jgi:hypothetical protein
MDPVDDLVAEGVTRGVTHELAGAEDPPMNPVAYEMGVSEPTTLVAPR